MRIHMSNIRFTWIRAFHAAALAGTTSAAAELLGIGQPVVSRHIAALERRLGLQLFERLPRGLSLTAAGRHLLPEAELTMDGMTRLQRVAEELRLMQRGHLSIVASAPIARGLLPLSIRSFRDVHGDVTLLLDTVPRRELARRLDGQQFDLGFVALPCEYPGEATTPIRGFKGMCVLPPDHPMAHEKELHLRDVLREPLICLPQGTVWRTRLDAAFDELGAELAPAVEAQSEITELVRAGVGIAVVDPFTAQTAQDSGLIARPFRPAIGYEMAILRPVARTNDALASEFSDHMIKVANRLKEELAWVPL